MAKRIGLLGGTFDPVHNGHLAIFQSFVGSAQIDELWVLLTPDPPHKPDKNLAAYAHRVAMLNVALEEIAQISISTIENRLPRPSYTIQTIKALKKEFPQHTFIYCLGGDSLSTFHTWKEYELILNEVQLLVAKRPDYDHSSVSDTIIAKATFVDHNPISVSSSQIRNLVNQGNSISDLVPVQVEDYILTQRLYK